MHGIFGERERANVAEESTSSDHAPLRQTTARAIRAQCVARVCTIAFLVVTGTSILSIWGIQVTSLAFFLRKRGLHPRNLLAPTSTLRFEYLVLAVV